MLELWGTQSTILLPSLSGPFWPGVVPPMGQTKLNCALMLYSHMQIHIYIYTCIYMQNGSQRHNDKGRAKTNMYLSFYCNVCVWEGVGDRTELQYIDLHSYGRQRCVFLVLQDCSTGGPGAHLSAGWWLSLLHLITNWSPKLHRGSRGPLQPGVAFPTTSCLRRLWSPTHQGPRGPLRPGVAFPTTSHSNCLTSCLDRVI